MSDLAHKEKDRIFCIHDIEHCLDVARIAYIIVLEKGVQLSKDIIYGASLLHDVGRVLTKENHHLASVKIAREILGECEYTQEEISLICDAIKSHREKGTELVNLSDILAFADKISRQCYKCNAIDECYWSDNKKNMEILI